MNYNDMTVTIMSGSFLFFFVICFSCPTVLDPTQDPIHNMKTLYRFADQRGIVLLLRAFDECLVISCLHFVPIAVVKAPLFS